MAFKPKRPPEEVFTPRAAIINDRMYINRPRLEQSLEDALKSTKYIVIHGESGNGKTWLYRKVCKGQHVVVQTLNLANAAATGSLAAALEEKLGDLKASIPDSKIDKISAGFRPQGMGIDKEHTKTVKLAKQGAFPLVLETIRKNAGSRRAVLVFDNFEQIVEQRSILRELASIIIASDDEFISSFNVKLLFVGVPGDIKSLISSVSNATTIANRLTEIPEVARMTNDEATELMKKGLESEIGLRLVIDSDEFYRDLCWKSDRIAQHIHEICLKIANEAVRNNGIIDTRSINQAEEDWWVESLSSDWAVIEASMNARETRAGRKNQVIYALGQCEREDFKYSDVEKIIRSEFPKNTRHVTLNVNQAMTSLEQQDSPLIRRTTKGDAYRFVSPKLRMAIRSGLKKTKQETVEKVF
jgi:hypothetical protein